MPRMRRLRRLVGSVRVNADTRGLETTWPKEGPDAIEEVGHRVYVGHEWEQTGLLQFDFLVGRGLSPSDVLVDVACGSLRAGVHFIPYLDRGNYLGLEKEYLLVDRGLAIELPLHIRLDKTPEFVVSDRFEFERFSKRPTYAIAHSLFTHLTPQLIETCCRNLLAWAQPGCRFFASFRETAVSRQNLNPSIPNARVGFAYTRSEMKAMGERSGWQFHYIGDWNHPRGQVLVEYVAPSA